MLETTVYISEDNLLKLENKKEESGLSINQIIICLFRREIGSEIRKPRLMQTVSYQEREFDKQIFRRFHISLDDDLYEKCLDLRKVFKMSVSYILALCIDKYLDDIDSDKLDTDNYPKIYMFFPEKDGFFKAYIIYWDKPKKKTTQNLKIIQKLSES